MAQSSVTSAPPTAAAPLQQPLQFGWGRIRAFVGGAVSSSGVTVVSYYWGRDVVVAIAASICVTIAIWPVAPTRQWYSPFITGLGMGGLLTGTFLWFRPYDHSDASQWLIAVAIGALLFWILPGRRGRPAFLLTMLLAVMIGFAVHGVDAVVDGSDPIVERFLDSARPSVVTLIVFAVAYTLYAMWLDAKHRSAGAGTFLVAAIIGASWATIIVDGSQRNVSAALLLTGALLLIEGRDSGRLLVESIGILIVGISAVRVLDKAELTGTGMQLPQIPGSVQIGVALIMLGVLIARGVRSE
ncbi:MAG: hypothetical protein AB7Q42_15105 [Acidimicrobiia bacterium]